MSSALSMSIRLKILRLKGQGLSLVEIARDEQLCYQSVRNIWQRYDERGEAGLSPAYDNCGQQCPRSSYFYYRCSCWLKRLHLDWGAPFIHMQLRLRYGKEGLPSIRTMQRWYCKKQLNRPRARKNQPKIGRSKVVHNIWQIDAKEQLTLPEGQQMCYLTITDEYSGGWLAAPGFPFHRISQVPPQDVRTQLIKVFQCWGKPKAIRTDNGLPLGSPEPSTTPVLALWLICMGIKVIWNPPASPQQNGCVEKMQDTSQRWAEVKKCQNLHQAQQQLDHAAHLQRQCYPVTRLNNRTRLEAFPQLPEILRLWDEEDFDAQRAYDFLAKKTFTRKVSAGGQFFHMNRRFSVGMKFKKQYVILQLDAQLIQWNIFDANGKCIKIMPAPYLSPEHLRNLSVYQ